MEAQHLGACDPKKGRKVFKTVSADRSVSIRSVWVLSSIQNNQVMSPRRGREREAFRKGAEAGRSLLGWIQDPPWGPLHPLLTFSPPGPLTPPAASVV